MICHRCILHFIVDTTEPQVLYCPGDVTTSTDSDNIAVYWTEPTTSGNVSVTRSHQPGVNFVLGATLVTYTFTDDVTGNVTLCRFVVTVNNSGGMKPCLGPEIFVHTLLKSLDSYIILKISARICGPWRCTTYQTMHSPLIAKPENRSSINFGIVTRLLASTGCQSHL